MNRSRSIMLSVGTLTTRTCDGCVIATLGNVGYGMQFEGVAATRNGAIDALARELVGLATEVQQQKDP